MVSFSVYQESPLPLRPSPAPALQGFLKGPSSPLILDMAGPGAAPGPARIRWFSLIILCRILCGDHFLGQMPRVLFFPDFTDPPKCSLVLTVWFWTPLCTKIPSQVFPRRFWLVTQYLWKLMLPFSLGRTPWSASSLPAKVFRVS